MNEPFFFFNLVDVSCCFFIKRWSCFLLSAFPGTRISLSLVLNFQLKCSHKRRLLCRTRNCCPFLRFSQLPPETCSRKQWPGSTPSVSQSRWGHVLVWWRSALHNPNHFDPGWHRSWDPGFQTAQPSNRGGYCLYGEHYMIHFFFLEKN